MTKQPGPTDKGWYVIEGGPTPNASPTATSDTEAEKCWAPPAQSAAMPRYFFNVHDGRNIVDDIGTEIADLEGVRDEAVSTAGELLRDGAGVDLWSGEEWKMVVTDQDGNEVLTLRFSGSMATGRDRP